jgi:filamentous hemagglutinin family protein
MLRSRTVSLLAAALIAAPPGAFANPLGGQVAGGQATIQGQGSATVTVTQSSQNAIINWYTFNIGAGETTQFNQPNAGAIALNRVTGGQGMSTIYGNLTANGRVFLINPNGVMIGPGGVVNAAGFLASTNDIKDSDFMAGNYKFTIPGRPDASIVNLGQITASNGGFAALVAPGVRNAGVITANLGNVTLASGNGFTLDFYGDKLITLQVGDQIANQVIDVATGQTLDALVKNEGLLKANGGQVALTAAAARHVVDSVINNTGVIEANSVGTKNGMIVLGAATAATKGTDAPTQTVKVSGTLSAAGHKRGTKGGVIQVTGEDIQVTGARLDASGKAGGGTVLIGGDTGGGTVNPAVGGIAQATLQPWSVATASSVSIDAATVINASAKVTGDGGKVVVWSNGLTSFDGVIRAGGAGGGSGGFVETSGHSLQVTGSVSAGAGGTWLLDPVDLFINTSFANSISATLNDGTDVTETTSKPIDGGYGNITVNAPITWDSGASLTLSAYNNIFVNANLTSYEGGAIKLRADNTGAGVGTVKFGSYYIDDEIPTPVQISTSGQVTIFYNPGSFNGENSSSLSGGNPYSQYVTGGGSLTAYMLVNNATDLQNIGTNLNGVYALGRDIDVSGSGIANFTPIGSLKGPGFQNFTGIFDGQYVKDAGPTISNLNIAPTVNGLNHLGLFASNAGTISNLHLSNVTVTANPNAGVGIDKPFQFIGTLAGENTGTISHVIVDGNSMVTAGPGLAGVTAGGLIGQNGNAGQPEQNAQNAQITYSHADVGVTLMGDGCLGGGCNGGWNNAGGLVGFNVATIANSSASGNVTVGANAFAGGLVGTNQNGGFIDNSQPPQPLAGPTIVDSFATGNVGSAGAGVALGGLVGYNAPLAVIATSYSTGGQVTSSYSISPTDGCLATGSCQFASAGGLVGQNQGTIGGGTQVPTLATGCGAGQACATNSVMVGAGGTGGGLVGSNDGIILNAFATGNVTGAGGPSASGFDHATNLGGLAGSNQGVIGFSFASGNVGTAGVASLQVGGLVADNGGTIVYSFAAGNVRAGDYSTAGGLTASNSAWGNNCGGCVQGDGFNQLSAISTSWATGNVTVGAFSIAGGLVATNSNSQNSTNTPAIIDQSWASGVVSSVGTGGNSIVGGLVGIADINSVMTNSYTAAPSSVSSGGPNSTVGGFIGINGGTISNSQSVGAVNGTSNSFLGGFAGINAGSVQDSTASGNVAGSGGGNVVGGFAGLNAGMIDPSSSSGSVSSGPNSIVGAFVGANGPFTNLPPNLDPNLTFPGTFDSGSQSTNAGNNPQVGSNSANSGNAGLPSFVSGCGATLCQVLVFGLEPSSPSPTPPPDNSTPTFNQQTPPYLLIGAPPNQNSNTPIQINLTTPGPGGPAGGNGNGGNGGFKPNYGPPPGPGLGRTADEQQYSGVPPPGETRFNKGELVIQVVDTVPIEQVVKIAQGLGLGLISTQHLDQVHRVLYRFRAVAANANIRTLIVRLEKVNVVASVQPNYNFVTAQSAPPPAEPPGNPDQTNSIPPPGEAAPDLANSDTAALMSLPAGDAAQYVIDKFHLGAVHRLASGRNVTIAVVDSEIDVAHPDLRGNIVERYDATQSPSKPHAHGTGMAGAIVSRTRLLGVAPGARILAIKAFDESASSAEATSYQILKGLDYAIAKNVRIINMSFAGPRDPMMERTLKSAHDKGIILIAAAGNAGPKSPPLYPGADPSVIAVSATDYTDKPFTMANRGKYIAVAAPGVDVMVPAPANSYQLTTGTSVAAAHVSGVAALLVERKPTITPDEVRALLMKTSTAFSAKPKGEEDGAGLVDPVGALQALAGAKTSDSVPSRSPVSASVH